MGAIVNCAAYRNGKKLGRVEFEDIAGALAEAGTFVWLGLHEPDLPLLRRVQQAFGLHDLAVEDALDAHQRPKLETYGDSVFVVLNTAQLVADEVVVGETHLFVGPNYVVSVRHGASSTYAPVRERCEQDPHGLANGTGYVLYALMDFVVDQYLPIVARLEDAFEALEQNIFRDEFDRAAIERRDRLHRHGVRFPLAKAAPGRLALARCSPLSCNAMQCGRGGAWRRTAVSGSSWRRSRHFYISFTPPSPLSIPFLPADP